MVVRFLVENKVPLECLDRDGSVKAIVYAVGYDEKNHALILSSTVNCHALRARVRPDRA